MTTIEHRLVLANDTTFHVATAGPGAGPPVLCLHGFPEGWMSWRPVMRELGRDHSMFTPDLRGYPSRELSGPLPRDGFDVFNLTEDVRALIETLGIHRPVLVGHDWGGALAWIFAHRYSHLISRLVVVNCTHPRTLARAILHFEDWQTVRVPWLPFFQIPRLPEWCMTTELGRKLLRLSFTIREGRRGTMDRELVDELVARFAIPEAMRGPVDYYRKMVATHLIPRRRQLLYAVYEQPISVPTTLIWGLEDGALSAKVARRSGRDAGCAVDWRPLDGIGHFVNLEAVDELVVELRRAIAGGGPERGPGAGARG
jgi:pimeloyl-ACP methyl ester carboxylesterase